MKSWRINYAIPSLIAVVTMLVVTGANHANAIPLTGTASLLCDIPEYANGINVVSIINGTGIAFSGQTSPLINPTLVISGSRLTYTFDATLASPTPANIGAIGSGTIIDMTIHVGVTANRFTQPGGPGTTIFINASDITPDSSEVMHGTFVHQLDLAEFSFDMTLSQFSQGSATLVPESADPVTSLVSKRLEIGNARISGEVVPAPEPASILMLGTGLALIAFLCIGRPIRHRVA